MRELPSQAGLAKGSDVAIVALVWRGELDFSYALIAPSSVKCASIRR